MNLCPRSVPQQRCSTPLAIFNTKFKNQSVILKYFLSIFFNKTVYLEEMCHKQSKRLNELILLFPIISGKKKVIFLFLSLHSIS